MLFSINKILKLVRRISRIMYIMIFVFLAIFGVLNLYVGLKGYIVFKTIVPFFNSYVYWVIFTIIAISFFLVKMFNNSLPLKIKIILNLIGSYWIGALSYLLLLFVSVEIISILLKVTGIIKQTQVANMSILVDSVIIIFVIILLIYGSVHAKNSKVASYNLTINKTANKIDSLNIVMVSDIHLGEIVDKHRLAKMVSEINELKPDLVLIAGDIIDDDITPFNRQSMKTEFLKIKSRYGVYGILGNHDYLGKDMKSLLNSFNDAGITILQDQIIIVENSFYIVGREDLSSVRYSGKERKPLEKILEDADKNLPIIVMDHQPNKLGEAEKNGVDVQFSGHTHGGQYFPGNLFTKNIFEDHWGYLKKGNTNILVSSGYGTWGPPIRIASDSEIINAKIKIKKQVN